MRSSSSRLTTCTPNASRIIRKYRSADPNRASFFSGCSKAMLRFTGLLDAILVAPGGAVRGAILGAVRLNGRKRRGWSQKIGRMSRSKGPDQHVEHDTHAVKYF